jgi:hypothetical protein
VNSFCFSEEMNFNFWRAGEPGWEGPKKKPHEPPW